MPEIMRVHLTFHVSLLLEYNKPSTLSQTRADSPPPITVEGEQEYEVDEILGDCVRRH